MAGWIGTGIFNGRQQSKPPEPKVGVAGHRGGMVEPNALIGDGLHCRVFDPPCEQRPSGQALKRLLLG